MSDAPPKKRGIHLGFPFDQLFDRNCDLEHWRTDQGQTKRLRIPALKLPGDEPGTGNVIITGPPGSGKSTLGLQLAVKCAMRQDNVANAAFFSLESSLAETISKAKQFGWHAWLRPARCFGDCDEFATPDSHADALAHLMAGRVTPGESSTDIAKRIAAYRLADQVDSADSGGDFSRRVFLFSLSPRPLDARADSGSFFWRRYQQVERLLMAAEHLSTVDHFPGTPRADFLAHVLKKETQQPQDSDYAPPGRVLLPVIVIDSLNMFGSNSLARNELLCLFSLFRKYHRIGVFVVESAQDSPFDSTIADVIVSLSNQKDRGYFVQHFEIQKSRYYNTFTACTRIKPTARAQE